MNPQPPMESHFTQSDRDLLVTLKVEIQQMKESFSSLQKDIKDNDAPKRGEFAALQQEIRDLRDFRFYLIGGAAALSTALSIITAILFHTILK